MLTGVPSRVEDSAVSHCTLISCGSRHEPLSTSANASLERWIHPWLWQSVTSSQFNATSTEQSIEVCSPLRDNYKKNTSGGHSKTTAQVNSCQCWQRAWDQHKLKPDKTLSWKRWGTKPHLSWGVLLNSCWEAELVFLRDLSLADQPHPRDDHTLRNLRAA